jgi:hypothetical protein
MSHLNPQPPFVWPEPRVLEQMCTYEHQPPFGELVLTSNSLFGIVSDLRTQGVDLLENWLARNPNLKTRLIAMVYPACATRQADLSRLRQIVKDKPDRLGIHIRPLEGISDRATNVLCFLTANSHLVNIVTGPSGDFGLDQWQMGQANFVFRAHPAMVEAFKRYFDWLWASSREITAKGVAMIPALELPEGTEEGARMWRAYRKDCVDGAVDEDTPHAIADVDPVSGDVTIRSEEGQEVTPPTEELGLAKMDQLAEQVARLYDKGALVSIDKLSRIPPLDTPLDPKMFGDTSELHRGNVTRRVSMRVSVIDEKTLKEINKRRDGLRTLLTKFSFGLANNMRWMPAKARDLFESELKRINDEGTKLVLDLLKGDVDAFIDAKRASIVDGIKAMYAALGSPGQPTEDDINRVAENLRNRLSKVKSTNFMPKLSYSAVVFAGTDNNIASPWGMAFALLSGVATFSREALTNSYFFRGLKVSEEDLIEAMNVADDALCRDLRARGIKDRCLAELDLISRIEKAPLEARDRCDLIWRILRGESIQAIDEILKEKEAS